MFYDFEKNALKSFAS